MSDLICGVITYAEVGVRVRCARTDDPDGHRGPHWQKTEPLPEGCACPDPICFCKGSVGAFCLEQIRSDA